MKMKSQPSKTRVAQSELPEGNYMCRVAQVLDLGIQPREMWDATTNSFKVDTTKKPAQKIMVTYEFCTEFVKDENGVADETKPRWLSEEIFLFPLEVDLATSTKRYKAIDPQATAQGDWTELVNYPCFVQIKHKKSGKAKVGGVSPAIAGVPVPELKNDPKVFVIDEPDLEIFNSIPEWIQEKIKSCIGYASTPLAKALGDGEPAKEEPKKEPAPQEDTPPFDVDGDEEPQW